MAGNGLLTGLISYWRLDNSLLDSIGSNNGTASGIGGYDPGIIGLGYRFNATSDYISVPDSDTLSFGNNTVDVPFSFSFWINPGAVIGVQYLFSKRDASTNDEYQFILINNTVVIALFSQGSAAVLLHRISGLTVSASVWNHVVITYSGNSNVNGTKIYINGVLSTGDITSGTAGVYVAMKNGTNLLAINSQSWSLGNGAMVGLMDEIGIWKSRELSAANVTSLYNGGAGLSQTLFS